VDSFRSVAAAIPLLLEHQGTGRVHAVVQEEGLGSQHMDFEGYTGLVQFGGSFGKDWRHPGQRPMPGPVPDAKEERGRGLIIQVSTHEFFLVGAAYRLYLRPAVPVERAMDASHSSDFLRARLAHYVIVDEGHFDPGGSFIVDRRRNGDETDHGVWVEADVGVVHVVMCE